MARILQPSIKLCCIFLFLCLVCTDKPKKNHTPWLQKAILVFVEAYNDAAKMEGNLTTINRNELELYLKMHSPESFEGQDADFVQKTLDSLDENRDGELEFSEFWKLQVQFMMAKYNQKYRWNI